MTRVALIDYGSGNLRSAAKALERAAADTGLPATVAVTADPAEVARADRIVLPGVGAFADCMRGLEAIGGMRAALEDAAIAKARPFLGICVGMQLMANEGHEHGRHRGLGWIGGAVERLAPADPALKIPHMGWNALTQTRPHPVMDGLPASADVYFVHSYRFAPRDPQSVIATADYGGAFPAVVGRANLIGVQFHPEKSQATGLALLAAFLRWRP